MFLTAFQEARRANYYSLLLLLYPSFCAIGSPSAACVCILRIPSQVFTQTDRYSTLTL